MAARNADAMDDRYQIKGSSPVGAGLNVMAFMLSYLICVFHLALFSLP